MIEIIGWIGSFLFAICALPQTIKTLRTRRVDDISSTFILMWLGGEICMITYALVKLQDAVLLFNYIGNLLCLLPIVYYKFKR